MNWECRRERRHDKDNKCEKKGENWALSNQNKLGWLPLGLRAWYYFSRRSHRFFLLRVQVSSVMSSSSLNTPNKAYAENYSLVYDAMYSSSYEITLFLYLYCIFYHAH